MEMKIRWLVVMIEKMSFFLDLPKLKYECCGLKSMFFLQNRCIVPNLVVMRLNYFVVEIGVAIVDWVNSKTILGWTRYNKKDVQNRSQYTVANLVVIEVAEELYNKLVTTRLQIKRNLRRELIQGILCRINSSPRDKWLPGYALCIWVIVYYNLYNGWITKNYLACGHE